MASDTTGVIRALLCAKWLKGFHRHTLSTSLTVTTGKVLGWQNMPEEISFQLCEIAMQEINIEQSVNCKIIIACSNAYSTINILYL